MNNTSFDWWLGVFKQGRKTSAVISHAEINEGSATYALALLAELPTFTSSMMKRAVKASALSEGNEAVVFSADCFR